MKKPLLYFELLVNIIKCVCLLGNEDLVNLLIQHGSDVNIKNTKDGSTPLHVAAWNGSLLI